MVGLAALSFLLGIWPLAGQSALADQPDLVALGPNWDLEIYLPLAEYLKEYPVGFSFAEPAGFPFGRLRAGPFPAPPNPLLWRINFPETRAGGLGFSFIHSGVGALVGQWFGQPWGEPSRTLTTGEAHRTFAPLMALFLALSVPSAYVFYRGALGLGAKVSLLATALLSVNSSLLYVLFWSFGQQVVALALFPLALGAGLWAVAFGSAQAEAYGGIRVALLGGLMLSALLVSYVPVVPFYLVLLGAMSFLYPAFAGRRFFVGPFRGPPQNDVAVGGKGCHSERSEESFRPALGSFRQLLGRGGLMAGSSVVLSPMVYWRLGVMVLLFSQGGGSGGLTEGPGVDRYAPLGWALGLLAGPGAGGVMEWPLVEPSSVTAILYPLSALGGLGIALLGLGRALRFSSFPLVAGFLAGLGLLVFLRFFLSYPYGYLKLLPFLSFFFIGAVALGLSHMFEIGRTYRIARILAAGIALVLLGLSLSNALDVVGQARQDSPHRFGELAALGKLVEPGASVYLSSDPKLQGPKAGALAYFLRRAELYGYIRTGYSTFYRLMPLRQAQGETDGVYDYALFGRDEMPYPELYGGMEPLWEGEGVRLYGRPKGVLAFLDLGQGEKGPVIARTAGRGRATGIRVDRWTPEGYPQVSGWSPPLLGVLSPTQGPEGAYPEVSLANPLSLPMDKLFVPSQEAAGGPKELIITLASFAPARLFWEEQASGSQTLLVSPGLRSYPLRYEILDTVLRAEGTEPVYVKSLLVREGSSGPRGIQEHRGNFVLKSQVELVEESALIPQGGTKGLVRLSLAYWGPSFTLVLDVYRADEGESGAIPKASGKEDVPSPSQSPISGQKEHFGWWALAPEGAAYWQEARKLLVEFDPVARTALRWEGTGNREQGTAVPLHGEHWEVGDGLFQANLFLWRDGVVGQAVPLFQFTMEGGKLKELKPVARGLVIG